MPNIDDLQIEIKHSSDEAVGGIDKLVASLTRLKTAARGGVGLTATSNQLRRLSDAVSALQDPSAKIEKLVSALKPLEQIQKTNLNSTLNALRKIPEITDQLANIDMGAFAQQIIRATDAVRPLAEEMNKVAAGFSAFPSRIQKLITQNEKLSASNLKASKSYGILGTGIRQAHLKIGALVLVLRRVARTLADWVTESNAYVENLNLMRISLRDASDDALEYAFKVREAFGIDPSEWIRFQSVFQNMATGFGVAADKATIMSKTLTQLGYDLATVFNVDYETAMKKLQSAIAGQPRPMREWGFDMSEATLKLVALNHGIKQNVETMTQYEKSQLRFIQLMETAQKQGMLGNFAREIITPANAMRILNQQIRFLTRSIGDLMIPILMKVLPYLQAFVKIVTDAARALAAFFGIQLPVLDYSGLGDFSAFAEDASGVGDSLDKGNKAAKKLKNTLMGFDELNILPSQNVGTGAAGGVKVGAGGGDLGLDLSAYNYDFLQGVTQNLDEYVAKMKELLAVAGLIGATFASWKIAKAISPLMVDTPFLPLVATITLMVARIIDLTAKSERFRQGVVTLGKTFSSAFDWLVNKALPKTQKFFTNLFPPGLQNAASKILAPMQKYIKDINLDSSDLLITLGGIGMLFTPAAPFGMALLLFEAITVGIRNLGYITSDAIEEINILGEGISDITKSKMEPFLDSMRTLDDRITEINWANIKIDDSIVADISSKVKGISKLIIDELDADKNEALKTLEPLKNALGEKAYNQLIMDNSAYYDNLKQQVADNEAKIIAIYEEAAKENRSITMREQVEIDKIRQKMNNMGIKHLSETEIEYQKIMNRLKNNSTRISLEQAREIAKNARDTRDKTIDDAERQYAKIELEAKRMYEVGAINKDQYDAMITAAQKTRKDTVREAGSQYNEIEKTVKDKLGSTSRYLDWETLEMKSKWQVFGGNLGTSTREALDKVKKYFTDKFGEVNQWLAINVFPKFTAKYWKDKFWGIVDGAKDALYEAKRRFEGFTARIKTPHISWLSGGTSATGAIKRILELLNLPTSLPKLSVSWYATGGFPDIGELFVARESGPELVGTMGGRTAVANNEQIVAAVSRGVAQAVSAVLGGRGDSQGDVYVYVGNEQVDAYVQRSQDRRNIRSNGR